MKDTLSDVAYEIFYEVSQKEPAEIDFQISYKKNFPTITSKPKLDIVIPVPRESAGKYFFQGMVFDTYEKDYEIIWSLFLASIYHTAAHANVTNYSVYESWKKNKTPDYCRQVIDFIEDVKAEQYLKNTYSNPSKNISALNSVLHKHFLSNSKPASELRIENFSKYYHLDEMKKITKIKEKIFQKPTDSSNLLECADILYKNRKKLLSYILPYCEHHSQNTKLKSKKGISIKTFGEFNKTVYLLNDLWIKESISRKKLLKKYYKYAKQLNFDEIEISPENMGEYLRLKSETSDMIKRIRNQLKMISNVIDDPRTDPIGLLEMQKAIQAVASQNPSFEFFEQDDAKRNDESWAIILDSSASTNLQFDAMKKFTLCVSEAADQINSRKGNWSLSAFNNNFLIVKDLKEHYNQQIKSRIGGISNKGLSFLPDAIYLATKTLENDQNDRKYIFLITDGKALGYDSIDENLKKALKFAQAQGISVIGIGVPEGISKFFTLTFPFGEIKKSVAKFIRAYITVAETGL